MSSRHLTPERVDEGRHITVLRCAPQSQKRAAYSGPGGEGGRALGRSRGRGRSECEIQQGYRGASLRESLSGEISMPDAMKARSYSKRICRCRSARRPNLPALARVQINVQQLCGSIGHLIRPFRRCFAFESSSSSDVEARLCPSSAQTRSKSLSTPEPAPV